MNDPYKDISTFVQAQEAAYRLPIPLPGNWNWSMKEHIERSYLYAHSQFQDKIDRPFKNITRPILNLQHRTEDIELKDVLIYVDSPDKYHLSFLVKKYHDDVFVKENDLDTFFDELNVSRIDYGAGLSKETAKGREVVPLQSIAFCDQTDMLSGPIAIKHFYSPSQLLDMEKVGWGEDKNGATASLQEVILLSREEKKNANSQTAKTPGKYIEVYEVHGTLPVRFIDPSDDSGRFSQQIHIVTFYTKENGDKKNITLYRAEEDKSPFKLIKRDPVYGRALGFGGAEELFEPQQWVNYDQIRLQDMLDAASKTILAAKGAESSSVAKRNDIKGMNNLSIIDLGASTDLVQVDTFPRNFALFERSLQDWEAHAQQMGAANDSIMGVSPTAGTPFRLQELVTTESRGLHEYRRGQYAKHIEDLYKEDFLPRIKKAITKGATFLSELTLEELQYVKDSIVRNQVEQFKKEKVLSGDFNPFALNDEVEAFKQKTEDEFSTRGSKFFIEILAKEFNDTPLAVKVVVAGKSKNLSAVVDRVVNIFRFAFSNPAGFAQVMQIPGMAKGFNQIIEFSGLDPLDFSGIEKLAQPPQPAPVAPPSQAPQDANPMPA